MPIYLNNAASSFPKPPEVIATVTDLLSAIPADTYRQGFSTQETTSVEACRTHIASFFGIVQPEQLIFTSGATESLNMAILGLDLTEAHVVTTAIEHNSVLRPLKQLEKEKKITLTIAGCSPDGTIDPEEIRYATRHNTRLIVVSQASNVTGKIQDIAAITAIAREKSILTIVDAAQSAGAIPIDVNELGCDMMAFTAHKSLLGIPGCGALFVRKGVDLRPLKTGGTGIRSSLPLHPEEMPLRLEAGTPNTPGIAALSAGINWIRKQGFVAIQKQKQKLLTQILQVLSSHKNIAPIHAAELQDNAGIISFICNDIPPDEFGYLLFEGFNITVRAGLHCAPLIHAYLGSYPAGTVRLSPSYFTTQEEIEALIGAIAAITSRRKSTL